MPSLLQLIKRSLQRRRFKNTPFNGSQDYWERRYQTGGHSGSGSYGELAQFKADALNAFVAEHNIQTVIEHGCGDGNQLTLAKYPQYVGYDVSDRALEMCRQQFEGDDTKRFVHNDQYDGEQAELAMSLDVIYHLVEDAVFDAYMQRLFASATRFVAIYSSDADEPYTPGSHVRQRKFSDWIEKHQPPFKLLSVVENRHPFRGEVKTGSMSDFFYYERVASDSSDAEA